MAKVFDYAVIYNGVYYPANTPIKEVEQEKKTEKEAEPKAVSDNADKRTGRKPKIGNSPD